MRILEVLSTPNIQKPFLAELVKSCEGLSEFEIEAHALNEIDQFQQYLNDHGYSGCSFPLNLSTQIMNIFPRRSQFVQDLQCFDFVEWSADDHFWPQLILHSHLRDTLIQNVENLDHTGVGYVVGANKIATCAIAVLVHLGMKRIRWVLADDDFLPPDLDIFKKKYFGVSVEVMSSSKLSLQNVDGSILISAVDYKEKPEVLQDICYFNFIKQESLVVDLHFSHEFDERHESKILSEAKEAGLPVLDKGSFIADYWLSFLSRFCILNEELKSQVRKAVGSTNSNP